LDRSIVILLTTLNLVQTHMNRVEATYPAYRHTQFLASPLHIREYNIKMDLRETVERFRQCSSGVDYGAVVCSSEHGDEIVP
jgi:hypothetical protein